MSVEFPNRTENPSGLVDIISADNRLIYKGEVAKRFFADNAKADEFWSLVRQMDVKVPAGNKSISQSFAVEYLPKPQSFAFGRRRSWHYKVDYENNSYFVKRTSAYMVEQTGGGYEEMKSAEDAKGLLKDLDWVEVVEYKIGYQDDRESLVVTDWNPALQLTVEDYLKTNPVDAELIKQRVKELKSLLKSFYNVKENNMAYDKERGKILLYDLNKKPEREISNGTMLVD